MRSTPPPCRSSRGGLDIRRALLIGARPGDRDSLARQLESVRPAEAGIRERAILLVPKLKAKTPFARHSDRLAFAQDVVQSLKLALGRARRPWEAHGADDPLLFEDETEAAAALIEAFHTATAQRGWWSWLTGGLDPPSWIRRAVLGDAFLLPRVAARLSKEVLEAWVGRLDSQEVESAFVLLAAAYGLPAREERRAEPKKMAQLPNGEDIALFVAEASSLRLGPKRRRLVALALLARHRPALVATPAASVLIHDIGQETLPEIAGARPRRHVPVQPAERPQRRHARRPASPPRSSMLNPDARLPPEPPAAVSQDRARDDGPDVAQATASARHAEAMRTRFGGLLFLLNAFTALGVCADFTRPTGGIARGSPFALLDRIGLLWLGEAYARDPLHALLTELAAASGGARLLLPGRWSAPSSWLQPWPGKRLHLALRGTRSQILWHDAGFPVAEHSLRDRRAFRGSKKAKPRQERRFNALQRRLPSDPKMRWLACLGLYLEARLARTLRTRMPIGILCRQLARVEFDGDRLTASFDLADHPLAVRSAGLDRNPGWIPASGRIVEFVFL